MVFHNFALEQETFSLVLIVLLSNNKELQHAKHYPELVL
jgi:hypothetical protein